MGSMSSADRKLTSSAGEHHVCSMLARHGWAASLTRDGLARTDVLAVHTKSRAMIEVQAKTTLDSSSWPLGAKGTLAAETGREWFVLVRLGGPPTAPESFVVPRDHVAAATWIAHMAWLTDPDAPAGKRNAGIESARVGSSEFEGYRDAWGLLTDHEDARTCPVMLPAWMCDPEVLDRTGLPDGHPWHDGLPPDWPGDGNATE